MLFAEKNGGVTPGPRRFGEGATNKRKRDYQAPLAVWRNIKLSGQFRVLHQWGAECCLRRGELREGRLHPFDIGFGHFFQIDQGISRNFVDPDQLIEFQLPRLRIAALGVLKAKTGTII